MPASLLMIKLALRRALDGSICAAIRARTRASSILSRCTTRCDAPFERRHHEHRLVDEPIVAGFEKQRYDVNEKLSFCRLRFALEGDAANVRMEQCVEPLARAGIAEDDVGKCGSIELAVANDRRPDTGDLTQPVAIWARRPRARSRPCLPRTRRGARRSPRLRFCPLRCRRLDQRARWSRVILEEQAPQPPQQRRAQRRSPPRLRTARSLRAVRRRRAGSRR